MIVFCVPVLVLGNELPKDTLERDTLGNLYLHDDAFLSQQSSVDGITTDKEYMAMKDAPLQTTCLTASDIH